MKALSAVYQDYKEAISSAISTLKYPKTFPKLHSSRNGKFINPPDSLHESDGGNDFIDFEGEFDRLIIS